MKKIALILSIILLIFTASGVFAQTYVPGELMIQFNNNKLETLERLCANFDQYELTAEYLLSRRMNIWLFSFNPEKISGKTILSKIKKNPTVKLAQFNHYVEERETYPDDEYFSQLWHLENTGQTGGTVDADIDAVEAWDINSGGVTALGDTIILAIIDSGNDIDHDDLNFWKNYAEIPDNSIDDDNNGYVDDYDGWNSVHHNGSISMSSHGTHVSGIAAALGNNELGVCGVNWNAKVMPIRGSSSTESVVVEAYGYVLEMRSLYNETNGEEGAFVVATNASFGVNFGNPDNFPIWCAMYDSLGMQGVLSVGATMNSGVDVDQLGDMPTTCDSDFLISVTNTTHDDTKNSGAAYGLISIDLGAPGTSIYSTDSYNSYGYKTGTSMAAPQVTGAIGLIFSTAPASLMEEYQVNPSAVALQIKEILLAGVDPIDALNGITVTGGRLNVHNSLQLIEEEEGEFLVSGNIEENTVWDTTLVKVVGDIIIDEGVTLTVNPGVEVEFQGYYSLQVNGMLNANGSLEDPVVFTISDTTGYSQSDSTQGSWKGIMFNGEVEENSSIAHCVIEYTKDDFSHNPPTNMSAIFVYQRDNLEISNNLIRNNFHNNGGAIICAGDANPEILNNILENNESINSGGALHIMHSSPHISDNIIRSNSTGYQGGGIFTTVSSSIIENNQIEFNIANQGAGLYGIASDIMIGNNHFEANLNTPGQISAGGGIYLWEGDSEIKENVFLNNSSENYGGAIHIERSNDDEESNIIYHNLFKDNSSSNVGGAISSAVSAQAIIYGNIFVNNTADWGGGLYAHECSISEITNNIFYLNNAENASAIYLSEQFELVKMQNNILWENIYSPTLKAVHLTSLTINFKNNLIQNGEENIEVNTGAVLNYEDNLESDPLLDYSNENYLNLTFDSPCINNGLTDLNGLFLTDNDLAGNPRIYNGLEPVIDMGPYEYQGDVVAGEDNNIQLPEITSITSIYPNPFSSTSSSRYPGITISFFCAENSDKTELEIFNIRGQKLKTIVIGKSIKGESYSINWDGKEKSGKPVASGIYFSRLTTNEASDFRKFIKIK